MNRAAAFRHHLARELDLVDVFPHTDRIVDLASVDLARVSDGANPIFVEISHPWPPNEANILEPATWRLELLVCGDNIRPERSFATLSFDGTRVRSLRWFRPETAAIMATDLDEAGARVREALAAAIGSRAPGQRVALLLTGGRD